jgi:hypothetical protein
MSNGLCRATSLCKSQRRVLGSPRRYHNNKADRSWGLAGMLACKATTLVAWSDVECKAASVISNISVLLREQRFRDVVQKGVQLVVKKRVF